MRLTIIICSLLLLFVMPSPTAFAGQAPTGSHTALNAGDEAPREFTRAERKAAKKKLKQALKDARQAAKDPNSTTKAPYWLIVILAILLPPLGVFLYDEEINNRFWISLLLTILFWIPGAIYAILIVTDTIK
ncbi:YqaE/Pmp3 family membrane protein [Pontibacter sp. G13]|uniref:YqaE/Pmp3 family membrane protein n=1 Tax=Pontibacter sp. G13 TaxID=3074898 RepID=UPI00288B1ACB|nr:YqaE/Pmp3 family membrane protein [Pontibacter sp. G13]WNJ21096.1 YqaE/Pmp3 family membrane protein [Pontibacter sp. G13]